MENQIDTAESQTGSNLVREKSSVKMRVWNIACYILFASGIAFFIFYIIGSQYVPRLNNTGLIILSVIAALLTIFICYTTSLTKIGAARFVALIIAGVVLAAGWFIYFRYLPKYALSDARAIVQADPKYASASIEPHYYHYPILGYCFNKDNPFCETGYILDVVSDGKVTLWIMFDSATGKYESYEPQD